MNKGIYILTGYYTIAFLLFGALTINMYSQEYESQTIAYKEIIAEYEERYDPSIFDERCVMYDKEGNFKYYENSNVNGLYFPTRDYYVVWIKDRTINETEATDKHEYCHYLVDNDYKHFCEE